MAGQDRRTSRRGSLVVGAPGLRSLLRVMIMSPRLHWLPSADSISSPGGVPARRWSRARWLSVQTSCRVGASVIEVKAVAAVVPPGVEDGVDGGGGVADLDALPVQVEAEALRVGRREGEGGGGFGGVGEPVQLGQPDRAVAGLDVAEHTAGSDRGELLIITDEPDTAAMLHNEVDGGVRHTPKANRVNLAVSQPGDDRMA